MSEKHIEINEKKDIFNTNNKNIIDDLNLLKQKIEEYEKNKKFSVFFENLLNFYEEKIKDYKDFEKFEDFFDEKILRILNILKKEKNYLIENNENNDDINNNNFEKYSNIKNELLYLITDKIKSSELVFNENLMIIQNRMEFINQLKNVIKFIYYEFKLILFYFNIFY
jgi:hypothetical protein